MEKVIEQTVSVLGQDRLGMELDTVHRVVGMLDRHDFTVLGRGGDPQGSRHRRRCNDEGMVPGGDEGAGQAREDAGSLMGDPGNLPVHWHAGTNDLPPVGRADALMAQAYAQNGYALAGPPYQVGGDPGFTGGAGPRRDDDVRRVQAEDLIDEVNSIPRSPV